MFELQGDVLDPKPVDEHRLDVLAGGVAVVVIGDEDVGGEGVEAGVDLPDVEVVDLIDRGGL
jgi:hypothetical protein